MLVSTLAASGPSRTTSLKVLSTLSRTYPLATAQSFASPQWNLPQRHNFSTTPSRALSSASAPARKPVQAKDLPTPGLKHPDGSYLLFHPIYSEHDLDSVKVVHRESKTFGDKVARAMCTAARTVFDLATRYPDHTGKKFPPLKSEDVERTVGLPSHLAKQVEKLQTTAASTDATVKENASKAVVNKTGASLQELTENEGAMTLSEMRKKGLCFGPDGWLNRIIFLETIAGVPGMVAATCRHLQSLRLMKRDKGWIHTMLEDAENERMHLLTFMELAKPGWIARTFALLAQGVFYNFFFVFYLVSPKVAHRFVGVLEEEAVLTYSFILEDLKEGRLPEWENVAAPEIAKQYWQLGDDAMLVDVIRAVRADEATHRHINHTFASLEATDPNPFALREPPAKMRAETYGLERDEALEWAKGKDLKDGSNAAAAAEKTA
ncbi:related to alternative oxidase precursor, mitochondrial [Ustilago trichophora]|uniref:Alternative oxidase n=1 Tax=Ustilago trichophora TaxID=86804 RepID=A0A5C3E4T8_9BASI|nr:related to alternative oxidase precursor, mitochondrial [Ustilago trichophora]